MDEWNDAWEFFALRSANIELPVDWRGANIEDICVGDSRFFILMFIKRTNLPDMGVRQRVLQMGKQSFVLVVRIVLRDL